MKKYELIIFDCDGTLVDSEPITNGLVAAMINEHGIEMTKSESLRRFAGKTIMDITDFIKKVHPDLDEIQFEKDYRSRCFELFQTELLPITGAKELLDELFIPFCIASNGPKIKMDVTLPATGLDQYFGAHNTFSAYDINAWKPAPDLFLYAADKMKTDPKRTLVIEDTWSGVMGAINGGFDVWALNPHLDSRILLNSVPNYTHLSAIQHSLRLLL